MAERRGTKALELWCRRMTDGYPGVKIDNMTTSWRDGLAFCAMIHHFRPDLIEFDKLNKSDVYYNNELAFTTAEKYLGIPALLDAVDMATYEVPDRLSILTYLSQFYQVFAAQDSPNRLKRPSPSASAEKTQITTAAGPPQKMAHVVGVPRRDPCQKCQLPVFLAERLLIGKKVYHRTCLKCARCSSQLTPGSFYETEVDGEYCCETCPDEEVILGVGSGELAAGTVQLRGASEEQMPVTSNTAAAVRSSIADRLAFFEQAKKGSALSGSHNNTNAPAANSTFLLQKSVSDEEKSKSLQRMEAPTSTYKINSALSNFLNNTIDGHDKESLSNAEQSKSGAETQMETSDTGTDTETETSLEETSPALPNTQPPSIDQEKAKEVETENVENVPVKNRRFTATAQLQLTEPRDRTEENQVAVVGVQQDVHDDLAVKTTGNHTETNLSKPQQTVRNKTELQLNLTTATFEKPTTKPTMTTAGKPERENKTDQQTDNINNNGNRKDGDESVPPQTTEQKAKASRGITLNLDLSEPNSNGDITKDKIANTNTIDVAVAHAHSQSKSVEFETLRASLRNLDAESPTEKVAASADKPVAMCVNPLETSEDAATTERLSVVRARLQQFEVIANKHNNNTNANEHANEDKCPDNYTHFDNNITASINNDAKLSDAEVHTETVNDQELPNTGKEVSIKIDDKIVTPPSTHTSEETEANASGTNVNLEDEEKLRAMEIERAENNAATACGTKEFDTPAVNVVPFEVNTTKDNNILESKHKPELRHVMEMPSIQLSEIKSQEQEENVIATITEETVKNLMKPENMVTETEIDIKPTAGKVKEATPIKSIHDAYPQDLNPFKSDDEDEISDANKENLQNQPGNLQTTPPRSSNIMNKRSVEKAQNLNPFDSSDDEVELEKSSRTSTAASTPSGKVPPPRPPPPRITRNPFGEELDEDATSFTRRSSLSSSLTKKTPVPTPRTNISQSQDPTPEPTPRLSNKSAQSLSLYILPNSSDYYGSANSLGSTSNNNTPQGMQRNVDVRGSNHSLISSAGGTIRSRKMRKAPAPPAPLAKELFPTNSTTPTAGDRQTDSSKTSTPSSSTVGTPKSSRKKRPAPAPPKPARLEASALPLEQPQRTNGTPPKNSLNYPLQSETSDSKLSDEEKALLEGKQLVVGSFKLMSAGEESSSLNHRSSRRVIPLDAILLEDDHNIGGNGDADTDGDGNGKCDDAKQKQQLLHSSEQEETGVVYRRVLVPPSMETPTHETNPLLDNLHDRQLEKLKDNKEAQNRNRQSQISASSGTEECDVTAMPYNKSAQGKWKRRKGPAPALPIPPRKVLQMLPLQEIRHELEIIEVQQQGLEKQGVILEKMIRDRCEGQNGELLGTNTVTEDMPDGKKGGATGPTESVQNSKEVEDLILQLFELVNEKNELFRRQAELMYLRRQHRLEQEQADLEYEIRVLMAQPERNKTDSDKAREETLIARLVEVVQLRNEVVECLEMDRLREAEEDMSIKQRLEMHTAQREDGPESRKATAKLSKKEKKKQKESKKLSKCKKLDADKDADESEVNTAKQKLKKKKKTFLF